MTRAINLRHRKRSLPSYSQPTPRSRIRQISSYSPTTRSGGSFYSRHNLDPIPQKPNYTQRRRKVVRPTTHVWQRGQDVGRLHKAELKGTVEQHHAVDKHKEGGSTVSTANTCNEHWAESKGTLHTNCTLSDIGDGFPPRQALAAGTRPKTKQGEGAPAKNIQDIGLLRHQALKELDYRERIEARKKYRETGDASVFTKFMAPFVDSPNRPDLGPWLWDASVERWRRKNELNGSIVWGPTDDCFT